MKILNQKDKHEFLPGILEIEDEPVSPLNRIIFWMVVTFIILALLWSILGKVDVVVTTNGKVIPKGEVKIIQPLNTGVVNKIYVSVNDHVKKGQPLIEIDPSQFTEDIKSMKKNIDISKLELMRLKALMKDTAFAISDDLYNNPAAEIEKSIYHSTKNAFISQMDLRDKELERLKEEQASLENERDKILKNLEIYETRLERIMRVKEYIRKMEIEDIEKEIYNSKKDHDNILIKFKENSINQEKIRDEVVALREDYFNQLQKEYSEKNKNLEYLLAEYEKTNFMNQKQLIVSPVNGYISQQFIHTLGGVVTPAEKLFFIVPDEEKLIVKTSALNKDVGFIYTGAPVTVKIDTYEYQKYGTIEGVVEHISKDSIEDENLGLIYDVYITPQKLELKGKENVRISSGMSVTAEIKIGKRRIIELLIFPLIRYFDDGMKVR